MPFSICFDVPISRFWFIRTNPKDDVFSLFCKGDCVWNGLQENPFWRNQMIRRSYENALFFFTAFFHHIRDSKGYSRGSVLLFWFYEHVAAKIRIDLLQLRIDQMHIQ